ncbi:MAG TPA: ATP-binding protein [Abditibacteriaceae bacterium]|jgi:signal transduction histidine kinase
MEIWSGLLDTNGFLPRTQCGPWTPALLRLHLVSDFFIWAAYLAIPCVLIYFASKRRGDLPFQQVFWLFGLFIVACGTTHLLEMVMFFHPVYRLSGVVKLVTAAASWGTVVALKEVVPRALAMRSPEVLEREIVERERAEAEVRHLNASLEARVSERTAELERANAALESANAVKDDLLQREKTARLEAEDANRAKDEFLATVSHELRTPLNSILGWSQLLGGGFLDEEAKAEAMQTIERSARSQVQIIDDILDVSSFVMGRINIETQPVILTSVIEASESAVRPTAVAKNIEIQTFLGDDSVMVAGDPNRLQQVVWNLLANAVKFTPKKGRILVQLRREGSRAVVSVSDNGRGIAPEFLPFVFDRFRQADSSSTREYGGLGLGLSIVKNLVELHGGEVRAESAGVGQGATFIVSLPLLAVEDRKDNSAQTMREAETPTQEAGSNQSELKTEGLPLRGVSVLVVDDAADARRMVSKSLMLCGAETKMAASSEQALSILETWHPHVVTSDIGMPGEDGLALIRKIRAREAGNERFIGAIALTAYAGDESRERSLDAGFQLHLTKPVSPQELQNAVETLAGQFP